MEWEEHDLEYLIAALGLEADDLFMMEKEVDKVEEDWLDVWMGSLTEVEGSSEVRRCMVVEDDTMEIAIMDEQDRDVDFMTRLVEERCMWRTKSLIRPVNVSGLCRVQGDVRKYGK